MISGIEGFVYGALFGTISTFVGIMLFAKYMNKEQKENYIAMGKKKYGIKNT